MAWLDYGSDETVVAKTELKFSFLKKKDVVKKLLDLGLVQTKGDKDSFIYPECPDCEIFRLGAKYIYYSTGMGVAFNAKTKKARVIGEYLSIYSGVGQRFPMALATDEVLTAFLTSVKTALDQQLLTLKQKMKEIEREDILKD